MYTLDVGCGRDTNCDVRVDICRRFKPTIICDAQHLPLKTNTFDSVNCSHLLEHVVNPILVIREIKRVAKKDATIVIKFPKPAFANNSKFYLYLLMFSFFPFALQVTKIILKDCYEILKHDISRMHRWVITLELIKKHFKINRITEYLSVCLPLAVLNKRLKMKHISQLYSAYAISCSQRCEE